MKHTFQIDVALQDYADLTNDELTALAHRLRGVGSRVADSAVEGAKDRDPRPLVDSWVTLDGGAVSVTIDILDGDAMRPDELAVLERALSQVTSAVVDAFLCSMQDREPRPSAITRIEKTS